MGIFVLILGVIVFAFAHLFQRLAPVRRAGLGNMGKIYVGFAASVAIGLMIWGYHMAPFVPIWTPPAFLVHVNNLLMLIAFWLFALSYIPGTISARIRHKQFSALKAWAIGHMLVNGDLAALILFGGLLIWAVVSVIVINRAGRDWVRPVKTSVLNDGLALGVGAVAMGVVAYLHMIWIAYPFGG
jgi:uncharacterized membrane protein